MYTAYLDKYWEKPSECSVRYLPAASVYIIKYSISGTFFLSSRAFSDPNAMKAVA